MTIQRVKTLIDIKEGSVIIITGDTLNKEAVKVQEVKISEQDGVEIIFDKKQNKFFNLGMFLSGKSWVKDCWIII